MPTCDTSDERLSAQLTLVQVIFCDRVIFKFRDIFAVILKIKVIFKFKFISRLEVAFTIKLIFAQKSSQQVHFAPSPTGISIMEVWPRSATLRGRPFCQIHETPLVGPIRSVGQSRRERV